MDVDRPLRADPVGQFGGLLRIPDREVGPLPHSENTTVIEAQRALIHVGPAVGGAAGRAAATRWKGAKHCQQKSAPEALSAPQALQVSPVVGSVCMALPVSAGRRPRAYPNQGVITITRRE